MGLLHTTKCDTSTWAPSTTDYRCMCINILFMLDCLLQVVHEVRVRSYLKVVNQLSCASAKISTVIHASMEMWRQRRREGRERRREGKGERERGGGGRGREKGKEK